MNTKDLDSWQLHLYFNIWNEHEEWNFLIDSVAKFNYVKRKMKLSILNFHECVISSSHINFPIV